MPPRSFLRLIFVTSVSPSWKLLINAIRGPGATRTAQEEDSTLGAVWARRGALIEFPSPPLFHIVEGVVGGYFPGENLGNFFTRGTSVRTSVLHGLLVTGNAGVFYVRRCKVFIIRFQMTQSVHYNETLSLCAPFVVYRTPGYLKIQVLHKLSHETNCIVTQNFLHQPYYNVCPEIHPSIWLQIKENTFHVHKLFLLMLKSMFN